MKTESSEKKTIKLTAILKKESEEDSKPVYGLTKMDSKWIIYIPEWPESYSKHWVLHNTYWEAYAELLRAEKDLPVRGWDNGTKVMGTPDDHKVVAEGWYEEFEELAEK